MFTKWKPSKENKASAKKPKETHCRNTIVVGYYYKTSTFTNDKQIKQNIRKNIRALNEELKELALFDIYKALDFPKQEYTFFSSVYRMFSR